MWHTHAKEYYATLKRKEILTHFTTGISLEDIVLSQNKPVTKRCEAPTEVKFTETESRMAVAGG
jgi:hypothetical protein